MSDCIDSLSLPIPVQPQSVSWRGGEWSENCPQRSGCHHRNCVLTKLLPYMVLTNTNTKFLRVTANSSELVQKVHNSWHDQKLSHSMGEKDSTCTGLDYNFGSNTIKIYLTVSQSQGAILTTQLKRSKGVKKSKHVCTLLLYKKHLNSLVGITDSVSNGYSHYSELESNILFQHQSSAE